MKTPHKYLLIIPFLLMAFSANINAQNTPRKINNQQIMLNKKVSSQKKKDSREQIAIDYYRKADYSKAAELFNQLYNEKKSNYYYSYFYNCLIFLKDYKKAEKISKQQRRKNPSSYRYIIDEAYATNLNGNSKKASKIINGLINNLPENKNQIIQISTALQARGYSKMAVKVLQKAQLENANNQSFDLELANAYLYAGEYGNMYNSYLNHLVNVPTDMQRVKSKFQYIMRMDVNSNLSDMLKKKLLAFAQRYPDNEVLAEMLMWYSMQTKDFIMGYRQAVAIDRRFGNNDAILMELGNIAYSNYDFEISRKAYNYVAEKGNTRPYYSEACTGEFVSKVRLLEENSETTIKDFKKTQKEGIAIIEELGVNQITSKIILNIAHITAVKLNNPDYAITLLNSALTQMQKRSTTQNSPAANNQEAMLKLELADILLITGEIWDASLLYSQVESSMKNEPIGHEAKLRNAKVFYYSGDFDWANTRLDVLKSSTSKLISNDAIELSLFITNMQEEDTLGLNLRAFAGSDLYVYQGKYDSALRLLNEIEKYPTGYYSMEFALYKKGEIYKLSHNYHKADSVYHQLTENYPESIKADNALFKQAEIQRINFNNITKAKDLYLKIMKNYPESIYAGKARKQYRLIEAIEAENDDLENTL